MQKKVKVLQLITGLGIGGAEELLLGLVKGLAQDEFDPLVCCLKNEGQAASRLKRAGIRVVNLGMRNPFDLTVLPELLRLIRDEKVDLIHTHIASADFLGSLAGRRLNLPVVSTRHSAFEPWWSFAPLRWTYRWALSSMDKVIAVSDRVAQFLIQEAGLNEKKVELIYPGINLTKFHHPQDKLGSRAKVGLPKEGPLVITVARLDRVKGHRYLLEAASEVIKVKRDTKFLVVGGGPCRGELDLLAKRLDIEKSVIFTGWRDDVPELLSACDIFVSPSLNEGFCLAALEAMASGLPVVAADSGGVSELVAYGVSGFLLPPKDPEELSRRMLLLLEDLSLRKKMGKLNRQRAEKCFRRERMIGEVSEVYRRTLEKSLFRTSLVG